MQGRRRRRRRRRKRRNFKEDPSRKEIRVREVEVGIGVRTWV
jgi:hypothetical protein